MITGFKSFFREWWYCLRFKDKMIWNLYAWAIVLNLIVFVWGIWKAINK